MAVFERRRRRLMARPERSAIHVLCGNLLLLLLLGQLVAAVDRLGLPLPLELLRLARMDGSELHRAHIIFLSLRSSSAQITDHGTTTNDQHNHFN